MGWPVGLGNDIILGLVTSGVEINISNLLADQCNIDSIGPTKLLPAHIWPGHQALLILNYVVFFANTSIKINK